MRECDIDNAFLVVGRWRRGESVSLKAARNSLVSLEVAAHAQMAFTKA
jgi:hypothetical protein